MSVGRAVFAAARAAFDEIREAPAESRTARLAALDPAVRALVERWLAAAERPGRSDGVDRADGPAFVDPTGRWRALAPIGEGGMGIVYRGERVDGAYRREVAIKLLAGAGTRLLVARSRRERELLARLDHPNIARLLDGGQDARGVPFLVMELVDGEPIDRWCARHAADAETRIRLIATVAEAVAHAHRQLIVHRDLKPSNILIDRAGRPKLLDFGIAGSLDPSEAALTGEDGAPMTLAYASPERLRGESAGVAADVWALGVILYELLAGELPFRAPRGRPVELAAAIADGARPRSLAALPRSRGGRRLGDEIDAISGKALAPEPARRYAGADRLAADLQALLEGRQVAARRPTLGYRLRVAWRRQWPVWAGVAAFVALTGYYAWSLSARLAEVERERDRARASADFFVRLFGAAEPKRVLSGEASARELLDRALAEIERGASTALDDRHHADLYQTVGAVHYQLRALDAAERAFERAVALRRAERPLDRRSLATHLNALAAVRRMRGDLAGAAALIDEALAARRAAGDTRSPEFANLLNSQAILLDQLGRHRESRSTFEQAIAHSRRLGPAGAEGLGNALNNLGSAMARAGDYGDCVRIQREALATFAAILRADHPRFVDLYGDLGLCLAEAGELDAAEDAFLQALTLGDRVLPTDDTVLARVRGDSARVSLARGDEAAARAALRAAVVVLDAKLGPDAPGVVMIRERLATLAGGSEDP
jgi:serine/threonine-protein kinase